MGYGMCSTGKHLAWVSVGGFRSFECECPPFNLTENVWRDVRPKKDRRTLSANAISAVRAVDSRSTTERFEAAQATHPDGNPDCTAPR